ncbi:hypothetical protein Tco_0889697 [Tanacetum coccineum]
MFDEYFNPLPSVASPVLVVVAPEPANPSCTPSSTFINQDAPSQSNSQNPKESQSPVISPVVKEQFHDIEKFSKGAVDPTLFTQKEGKDILLVKIYVDDIILASTDPTLCETFSEIILRGIFLNQSKYALEIIKKYGMESCDLVDTPMVKKSKLDAYPQGKEADPTHYRGMIGPLMYLTTSIRDLVFVVCMSYADADHAGFQDTQRSTSSSMQLLGNRLVSWSSKK